MGIKVNLRSLGVFAALGCLVLFYNNCSSQFQAELIEDEKSSILLENNYPPSIGLPNNSQQALPAVSGTPLIKQIRNGQVVATYTKLGEAFARTHTYRKYEAGDIYELEPAVYLGDTQQAWIGSLPKDDAEYNMGEQYWQVPKNITIRGLTKNGYRPVIRADSTGIAYNNLGQGMLYIATSENLLIENIDFDGGGSIGGAPKGGIYINGVKNLVLRNSRVLNFTQANGVFGTDNNSGTILFENVETGFNGGDSGPEHNYYMGGSKTDPSFTIIWRGCYSHDVYYGHALKSRAQNNVVEGCYFKGKKVSPTQPQGEAFLADFPNGGKLIFRNNILEKDYSGDYSNGISIGYAMEGQQFQSTSSVTITHNTFVARSIYFDSQNHELYPMNFYYPPQIPGTAGFPVPTTIQGNLFVGFLDLNLYYSANQKYRGDDYKIISLSELNADFSMKSPMNATSSAIGQITNIYGVGSKLRTKNTFGALD